MIYGILNGEKVEASPEIKNAKCQCCDSDLIAKCGEIKIWHFAHKSKNDCSSWWKPMTEWHKSWQEQFPKKYREVVHKDPETGEKHIADIKIPIAEKQLVIEFQNSSITKKEIESRELFYKDMIWVLNGEKYEFNIRKHHDFLISAIDGKLYQVFENGNMSVCKIDENTNYDEICKYLQYGYFNLKYVDNNFLYKSNKQIYIDFGNNKMGYIKFIDTKIIFYNNYSNTISLRYNGSRYLLIEITKDQFLQKFSQ